MKMDATFTAEDDKITKTSVKVTMDLSAAGLGDTELTDDQKKQLETAVLSQLGVEEGKVSMSVLNSRTRISSQPLTLI